MNGATWRSSVPGADGDAAAGGPAPGKRTPSAGLGGAVQRRAAPASAAPAREAAEPGPVDDPFGMHLLGDPVRDEPRPGAAEAAAAPPASAPAEAARPAGGPVPGPATSPGAVRDAPTADYLVPFDRNPLAAPGERIICVAEFTGAADADYEIVYTCVNGHFTTAAGPTTVTIQGLRSGNVNFFVPSPWNGTDAVSVTMQLRKKADASIAHTATWTYGKKAYYPTTMTQVQGTGERTLPADYDYDIGPARAGQTRPFYQHQTILEWFDNWSIGNIATADLDPAYARAHGLTTPAAISAHFLGTYAGNNGTFTVDASDQVADTHGGHPDVSNLVSKLVTPKDIEVALPQTYEAQPGTALARFMVTRVRKADGSWKVKKAPR